MSRRRKLCRQVVERLGALLDGELTPLESLGVETHLRGCAPCRSELERLAEIADLVRREGRAVPPPPPWTAVETRLVSRPGTKLRGHFGKLVLAAAALFAGLGAGWLIVSPTADGAAGGRPPAEKPAIRQAGIGLPGLERFLLRHRAVEVEPSELARHRLSFVPRLPARLPARYRFERTFLIEGRCFAGVCFLLRDDEDRLVGLVQQPSSHPLVWEDADLVGDVIGGTACLRARLTGVELTQVDPDGLNLTLVVASGFPETEALVRLLARPRDPPPCPGEGM